MKISFNISYSQLLNKLNGWQRLYLLIVLVASISTVVSIDEPKIIKSELVLDSYLSSNPLAKGSNCDAKGKCEYLLADLLDEASKDKIFKVNDGTEVLANEKASLQEVQVAYEKALKDAEKNRNDISFNKYKSVVSDLVILLGILYFSGWMIGWVIKGFKKHDA
jgi:hypothetical protein